MVGVNRAFAAPAAAAPLATVTVASGDTLSAIAARMMPGLPIRSGNFPGDGSLNSLAHAISAGATSSSRLLVSSTRLSSAAELSTGSVAAWGATVRRDGGAPRHQEGGQPRSVALVDGIALGVQ